MGSQNNILLQVAIAFLAASTIAEVNCVPAKRQPEQFEMFRENILAQLGLTELPPPVTQLTQDQEKVVAAFKDYHLAKRSTSEKANTSQQRLKRQEGASGEGHCRPGQATCCLHPLNIHFHDDLGLDFIIQPRSFDANYCLGSCSLFNSPTVFAYYSLLSPNTPASSIEPHCGIRSTRNLEVLMAINGQLVIEEMKDVTVTACGCV